MSTTINTPTTDQTDAPVRTDAEQNLWVALSAHPNNTSAFLAGAAEIGRSTASKILARWASDGTVTRTPGIASGGQRAADLWAIPTTEATAAGGDTVAGEASQSTADEPADLPIEAPAEDAAADPRPSDSDAGESAASSEGNADTDEGGAASSDVAADDADTDTPPADPAPEQPASEPAEVGAAPEGDGASGKGGRMASGVLRGLVEDYLRDNAGEEFSPHAIARALGGKSAGAVNNICGSFGDPKESAGGPLEVEREVADVLVALESEGLVESVDSGDEVLWRAAKRRRERLPQGGLQGLVEDFLIEHRGQELGPHAIGTALSRSAGAVANALVRLTERGVAELVSERPRRYRSAATE